MTQHLERLLEIVACPVGAHAYNWNDVSARVGVEIPRDFRALVERLGAGVFDDVLFLCEPNAANPNFDLATLIAEREEAIPYLQGSGMAFPEELVGPGKRLIAFAGTDSASYLHWLVTEGTPSSAWPIVVNEAGMEEWLTFPMTATEFLAGMFSGDIHVEFYSWLRRGPHSFVSHHIG